MNVPQLVEVGVAVAVAVFPGSQLVGVGVAVFPDSA